MKLLFAVLTSWVLLAPARAQAPNDWVEDRTAERRPAANPPDDPPKDGTYELLNRGWQLKRENEGARGRINSTNDAARDAEEPRAVTPGFSPWGRW